MLFSILISTCLLLLFIKLLLNWYSLSHIPGPILAGCSDFWRAYYQINGALRNKLLVLHKRHGPIVRYGVSSISIADPSAIDIIYGSRAGFVTAESYDVLIGISNGKEVASVVSTRDEAHHGALRKSMAGAFSPNRVLDYEKHINDTVPEFLHAISKRREFDFAEWIMYYSMDAAALQLIRDRFYHWGKWSSLPWLERLVYRNPIAMRAARTPSNMAAKAAEKLQTRTKDGMTTTPTTPDLLGRFLEASKVHPETLDSRSITGLLMSSISGSGDTTATSVTAIVYYLLQNPLELDQLRRELHDLDTDGIISSKQINKLPFLNAAIKEGMRLFPTPTWPMERQVPSPGIISNGISIPAGTSIGCMPSAVHLLNTDVWGDDVDQFRPGRWLEANAEKLRQMESAFLGFSRGRRICPGQHIAVMSMKKVIASLFLKFEMSLVHPERPLDADFSSAVACLKPVLVRIDKEMFASRSQ